MQKTIVITGVSKGIGWALAKEFCAQGHTVYGCARKEGEEQKQLEAYTDTFFFKTLDMTDHQKVAAWADEIVAEAGKLDLLINNAAIVNQVASAWEIPLEEIQALIDINVVSIFASLRAFIPHMLNQPSGMIVNMSSGWGREGGEGVAPYAASKFAVEGLTQSIALELPKNLGIVTFAPDGGVKTEMLASVSEDYYKAAPMLEVWAKTAARYLLNLGVEANGQALTCPALR